MAYTSANKSTRKKFLTIILALALLLLLYGVGLRFWFSLTACVGSGNKWIYITNECHTAPPASKIISTSDFDGVIVQVPSQNREVEVRLNNQASIANPSGSWGSVEAVEKGSVVLLVDKALYVKESMLVPMIFNFGGSGYFVYLGLFTINVNAVEQISEPLFVGDGVAIESLTSHVSGDEHVVNVYYLEHGPGQSFAEAPQHKASKMFIFDGVVVSELK